MHFKALMHCQNDKEVAIVYKMQSIRSVQMCLLSGMYVTWRIVPGLNFVQDQKLPNRAQDSELSTQLLFFKRQKQTNPIGKTAQMQS